MDLLHVETLFEPVYTATGINKLLLAGIERMALGADLNTNVLAGGAGLENLAASASDRGGLILGMYVLFHLRHLFTTQCLKIISQTFVVCNTF